ncbi:hypothetical protein [Leucobacter komagatae]|uniref:Protein ImuA n=1 Tax=Leucobacter komagatae TaxID=55969 RepID=A0A0D0IQQ3_9MICO|nr:hypothetical protein [Leucobacter komagatae]KIP53919.1 hypothetical protein SD72_00955 [Leucobacter komagatae]
MSSAASIPDLRQRITEMQPLRIDERALPTAPGLGALLPGGALRAGSAYSVQGSWQLALAFLAEASRGGAWCGVLGCPAFGAEAAVSLGIALDRCVLIPEPGRHALTLAGTLSETLSVVVARFDTRVSPADIERLGARLREHGSALVVVGEWAKSESRLTVVSSRWTGLGAGNGALATRELTVQSEDRRGTKRHSVRFERGCLTVDRRQTAPVRTLRAV